MSFWVSTYLGQNVCTSKMKTGKSPFLWFLCILWDYNGSLTKSSVQGSEFFLPLFPIHSYSNSCEVSVPVISFFKRKAVGVVERFVTLGRAVGNHTAREEGWTKIMIFQTMVIFVTNLACGVFPEQFPSGAETEREWAPTEHSLDRIALQREKWMEESCPVLLDWHGNSTLHSLFLTSDFFPLHCISHLPFALISVFISFRAGKRFRIVVSSCSTQHWIRLSNHCQFCDSVGSQ